MKNVSFSLHDVVLCLGLYRQVQRLDIVRHHVMTDDNLAYSIAELHPILSATALKDTQKTKYITINSTLNPLP